MTGEPPEGGASRGGALAGGASAGGEPDLVELRALPAPALAIERRRAVGRRAGEAFEQAHRGRVRALAVARVAFAVVLTGATAVYLVWAICVARTFG